MCLQVTANCYGGYKVDQARIVSLTIFRHKRGTKICILNKLRNRSKERCRGDNIGDNKIVFFFSRICCTEYVIHPGLQWLKIT